MLTAGEVADVLRLLQLVLLILFDVGGDREMLGDMSVVVEEDAVGGLLSKS